MKQSKKLEAEKEEFLSLCCSHDKALLNGKERMTKSDFERITFLTMSLDLDVYTQYLHECHMDYSESLSQQLDRENEIIADYPDYYLDEHVIEKQQAWVDDFCNHIPAEKREYYRKKLNTVPF